MRYAFLLLAILRAMSLSALDATTFRAVMQIADECGVPRSVARQLMHEESSCNPLAIGAESSGYVSAGLFQIHTEPGNIAWLTARFWSGKFDIFDPIHNATVAMRYLAYLHKRFGSWYLACCHYNCGPNSKTIPERTKRYARRIIEAP